ncbi:MAG TPA: hypothetical protein VGG41_12935 [Solirubrobacteraceae bacterium]|jgi:hypothetical protein
MPDQGPLGDDSPSSGERPDPKSRRSERRGLRGPLIGAAAVILAAAIAGIFELVAQPGGAPTVYQSDLQVEAVSVVNQPVPAAAIKPQASGAEAYPASVTAAAVITLRNPGTGISVITGIRFTVKRAAVLKNDTACDGLGSPGGQGTSGIPLDSDYQVTLPARPRMGQTFRANISEQVPANTADRFRIAFSLPGGAAFASVGASTPYVYVLAITLLHDTAQRLPAGLIIVASPFPSLSSLTSGNCVIGGNTYLLTQILRQPGIRSRQLDEVAAAGAKCYSTNRPLANCDLMPSVGREGTTVYPELNIYRQAASTWVDPVHPAKGRYGEGIPSFHTVLVLCEVRGKQAANGDTWWYRLYQRPWLGYYASAAWFANGANLSSQRPFSDPAVPACSSLPPHSSQRSPRSR